jgi:hypothetical protein
MNDHIGRYLMSRRNLESQELCDEHGYEGVHDMLPLDLEPEH